MTKSKIASQELLTAVDYSTDARNQEPFIKTITPWGSREFEATVLQGKLDKLTHLHSSTLALGNIYLECYHQSWGDESSWMLSLFQKHSEQQFALAKILSLHIDKLCGTTADIPTAVRNHASHLNASNRGKEVVESVQRLRYAHGRIITQVEVMIRDNDSQGHFQTSDILEWDILLTNELQLWIISKHIHSSNLERSKIDTYPDKC